MPVEILDGPVPDIRGHGPASWIFRDDALSIARIYQKFRVRLPISKTEISLLARFR
jgi:hypothetical protein